MPDRVEVEDAPGWHLDKKVPIALIGAFIVQTAIAIWVASGISKTVDHHELRITKTESDQQKQDDKANDITGRLIRLEERTGTILDNVKEIKDGMQQRAR